MCKCASLSVGMFGYVVCTKIPCLCSYRALVSIPLRDTIGKCILLAPVNLVNRNCVKALRVRARLTSAWLLLLICSWDNKLTLLLYCWCVIIVFPARSIPDYKISGVELFKGYLVKHRLLCNSVDCNNLSKEYTVDSLIVKSVTREN